MSATEDAGVGWSGKGGFGLGLGAFLGGRGGGDFGFGGWEAILSRTGKSANKRRSWR